MTTVCGDILTLRSYLRIRILLKFCLKNNLKKKHKNILKKNFWEYKIFLIFSQIKNKKKDLAVKKTFFLKNVS